MRVRIARTRRAVFSYRRKIKRAITTLTKTVQKTRRKIARLIKKNRNTSTQFLKKHTRKSGRFVDKHRRIIGIILVFLGIQSMIIGLGYSFYAQTVLSFKTSPTSIISSEYRRPSPTHIQIENNLIDLSIESANIRDGIWEISESRATHLQSSGNPGENTNIVIYAHNKWHLFYPLHAVEVDHVVTITTEDGEQHRYRVIHSEIVSPDQIEKVLPTESEVLTLYTCTGWFDAQRLVIQAVPVE